MGERYPITGADVAMAATDRLRKEMLQRQHAITNARLADDQPKLEVGDPLNRCPHCGLWLSTRYSTVQPHQCEVVQDRADLQTPLPWAQPVLSSDPFPPHWRAPAQPAPPVDPDHARSAAPGKPVAWAATARALATAWWFGCLSGAFVTILAIVLQK